MAVACLVTRLSFDFESRLNWGGLKGIERYKMSNYLPLKLMFMKSYISLWDTVRMQLRCEDVGFWKCIANYTTSMTIIVKWIMQHILVLVALFLWPFLLLRVLRLVASSRTWMVQDLCCPCEHNWTAKVPKGWRGDSKFSASQIAKREPTKLHKSWSIVLNKHTEELTKP